MPNRIDFDFPVDRPDLSPALSGIFTYGIEAIDFNERDVRHFNEVARALNEAQPALTTDQLAAFARRVLRSADASSQTPFIKSRLRRAAEIRGMASDAAWPSEPATARRIHDLLAYIDAPSGLFNDATPVIGYLDDALLVDIAMDTLRPELDLYAEFCRYRRARSVQLGIPMQDLRLTRADWEREHDDEQRLEHQLRRVHESSYSGGETDRPFHVF